MLDKLGADATETVLNFNMIHVDTKYIHIIVVVVDKCCPRIVIAA